MSGIDRYAKLVTRGIRFNSTRPSSIPTALPEIKHCLNDPDFVKLNLVHRNYPLPPSIVDDITQLESSAVTLRLQIQKLREQRNALSKERPAQVDAPLPLERRSQRNHDSNDTHDATSVKKLLKQLEPQLAQLTQQLYTLSIQLPNISHPASPIGDESKARIVKTLGPPISCPPPPPDPSRDHHHLAAPDQLGWTDFPTASLVSGSSWPYLLREGALLELALTNYAMSLTLQRGFTPVLTPDVIRHDIADRCGFRPREGDSQQTYFLGDGRPDSTLDENTLCLAGTAEIPLVAMTAATVLSHTVLPLKHVALGKAFRAEAGARGIDSRGLYRVHQFSKVEMVVICHEEESDRVLEDLRKIQEDILGSLGLSLRVLDMPTQELGASAHRKYDIEAWMPGRGKWGELSSASNCTDYQSRRLSIRYRPNPSKKNAFEDLNIPTPAALEATALHPSTLGQSSAPRIAFAHTLNATAAAIPRLIIAILENGVVFHREGKVSRVRLPGVLKRFWIGDLESERIEWVKEGENLRID